MVFTKSDLLKCGHQLERDGVRCSEGVKMILDADKVNVVQAQLPLETRKVKREKTRTMKNKDIEEKERNQEEEEPSGRFRLTCE